MHSRLLILLSLFLLHIVEVAKCAPSAPQNSSSVYDKLVELTKTEKCTYLENTLLSDKKLLSNCGSYEDALDANLESLYNLNKLHCLLYFDTFQDLCVTGKERDIKTLIGDTRIKAESIQDVCSFICKFYTSHNESKVARIMSNNQGCKTVCTDLDGKNIEACALSALMLNVTIQLESINKLTQSKEELTQNSGLAAKSGILSSDLNSELHPEMQPVLDPLPAKADEQKHEQHELHVETIPESIEKVVDKSAPKEATKDKDHQLDNVNQSFKNNLSAIVPVNAVDKPMTDDSKINSAGPLHQSLNGQKIQETITNNPQQKSPDTAENKLTKSTITNISKVTEVASGFLEVAPPKTDTVNKKDSKSNTIAPEMSDIAIQKEIPKIGENNEEPDNDDPEEEESLPIDESDEPYLKQQKEKPLRTNEDEDFNRSVTNDDLPTNDSYFFSYFMMVCILFVMGYVGYHNKQKILALLLEGRRGRRQPRRRPNSANYHKLDSNLEEAVMSSCDKTTSNVIY